MYRILEFIFASRQLPIFQIWSISVFLSLVSYPCLADDINLHIRAAFQKGLGSTDASPLVIQTKNGITSLTYANQSRQCALCSDALLLFTARTFGVSLAAKTNNEKPAQLTLHPQRSADTLHIDGWKQPKNQKTIRLEPGPHVLTLTRNKTSGHATVQLAPSQNLTLHQNDFSFGHLRRDLQRVGVATVGMGAAILLSGVAFIGLNEDCASLLVDTNDTCRAEHNTKSLGIIFTSIGAAIIASGITLLIVRARKNRREKTLFLKGSQL